MPKSTEHNSTTTDWRDGNDVPGPAEVEQARIAAIAVWDALCGMAYHAGVIVDAQGQAARDADYAKQFPGAVWAWWSAACDSFHQLDTLVAECDRVVRPFGLFFDRVSAGTLTLGPRTYANAHVAARDVLNAVVVTTQPVRRAMTPDNVKGHPEEKQVDYAVQCAAAIRDGVVTIIGPNYQRDYSLWVSLARRESAQALSVLPPPAPKLAGNERMIVEALRMHGKPLTQVNLLVAAKLNPDSGTNKSLLSVMRDRGDLTNKGKGYGLPEWDK
jgi:hypothetical protein